LATADSDRERRTDPQIETLVGQLRDRARNLYESRQLLCTEAVLEALNEGLDGGLSHAQVVALAAPFCEGLGDSGCLCGALSGAVLACGLFLGNPQPHRRRREVRESARELHDAFRAANGATCCRVLSRKVKHDRRAHFRQCAGLTAQAAEMAARLILNARPDLVEAADRAFLTQRQSGVVAVLLRLARRFSSTFPGHRP
jgi:C_GCAxxG_C_C family probable redox protein